MTRIMIPMTIGGPATASLTISIIEDSSRGHFDKEHFAAQARLLRCLTVRLREVNPCCRGNRNATSGGYHASY